MTASAARARMLVGLPITERVLDVGGVETTVLEAGDGPPLLLLHGGIECGGAYWAPVIARLAERNRLVVPDAPGLGESAPVDRLDDDTFAAWFAGVLDQTHCVRPTLVAHSLLGSAAARLAARRGDLVQALVVYGAPGVGPYRMPMRLRYVAIRFALRPTPSNAERFDRLALLDLDENRRRDPEWFAAFDAYARSRASVRHVKRTMRRLIANRDEADTGHRAQPHRGADHAAVGSPRPDGSAGPDTRRGAAPRLAPACDRRRRPRPAHGTARCICRGAVGDRERVEREERMTMETTTVIDELGSRTEGAVLRPDDEGWDDAVLIWNGMVAQHPGAGRAARVGAATSRRPWRSPATTGCCSASRAAATTSPAPPSPTAA